MAAYPDGDRTPSRPPNQRRTNRCLRAGFGNHFVDYYVHIKDAEIARYREEVIGESDQADVTEWEHREYFDAF
jgi:glutamine synthetase